MDGKSLITHSADQTREVGRRLAAYLRPGDVVLLSGAMGTGKSELCRGIARGMGIQGRVPSPSFTVLNLYDEGSMLLKHFDWYRVESPEELLESGLDEQIGGEGITAIEWHERAPHLLPHTCLEVRIEAPDDSTRCISLIPLGHFRQLPWGAILGEDI